MSEESASKTTVTFQAFELVEGNLMPLNYQQSRLVLNALEEKVIPIEVDGIGSVGLVILGGTYESPPGVTPENIKFLNFDDPRYESEDLLITIDSTGIEGMKGLLQLIGRSNIHTVNDARYVIRTFFNGGFVWQVGTIRSNALIQLLNRYYKQKGIES